ncbi:MAG TPA: cytidine deaminase [Candidatus Baltobacteraceae bacterium]|nr:cytidine deaminase [Candidatus Baltobacteraceae bacterium]
MRTDEIVAHAKAMRERAYAPYSGFAVGAALVTEDGTVFGGANVENASYGLGICAERSAAVSAVAAGNRNFRAIAIAGPETTVTAPCGACRQFLNEFNPQLAVIYTTPHGVRETTLDELLPDAFGPKNLR